jgi:4-hydroxybenzoate polyprenyltransferase
MTADGESLRVVRAALGVRVRGPRGRWGSARPHGAQSRRHPAGGRGATCRESAAPVSITFCVREGADPVLESEPSARAARLQGGRRTAQVAGGLVRCMRPQQWTKNVFVFAGLVFSQAFLHVSGILVALGAFGAFCLLSSAVYCLNDFVDRERDRLHPRKRLRPMASGLVAPAAGLALGAVAGLGGLGAALALGRSFFLVAAAYLVLNIGYSFGLKHVPLWDALAVAGGFVLRALAGTSALNVTASPWLLVCTYLVALYLSLGKRWSDAVNLPADARAYRRAALVYEPDTVRLFMQVVMSATLMSYALYAVEGPHRPWMLVTLPFVIYGLFHYQHMVEARDLGGAPESAIFQDRAFLANAGGFAVVALAVLLGTRHH